MYTQPFVTVTKGNTYKCYSFFFFHFNQVNLQLELAADAYSNSVCLQEVSLYLK